MSDKVGVKQVQALNSKIVKLNTQRTEIATKINLYKANLAEELKNYASTFGVNLSGKTLGETKKKVQAEVEKISQKVQEEYELKKKVVECIESGNIDAANELLGIQVEESEPEPKETGEAKPEEIGEADPEEIEEAEGSATEPAEKSEEPEDLDFDGNVDDIALDFDESTPEEGEKAADESDEEDFRGFDFSDEVQEDEDNPSVSSGRVVDEDDSESSEEDFGFDGFSFDDPEGEAEEPEKEEPEKGSEEADGEDDTEESFSSDDLTFGDEDDDFGEDFGFGALLGKGSKF